MTRKSPLLPNKPTVPTAPGAFTEPARRSRRRHIGEPIGRVVPERNALAHGADEEVTAERHEGVMRILVDCHRVGAWWTRGTTAKASIPGLLHARVYRST